MIDKIFVKRCIVLLKCLVASYVITGIMLVMIAGGLYKFSLSENIIDIAIILTCSMVLLHQSQVMLLLPGMGIR